MSDSSLSGAALDDNVLEEELRQVVRNIYKAGNLDELTVKRVRCAAETSLALSDGFYKEPAWKERSKAIIESEAESAAKAAGSESSPVRPKKSTVKRRSPGSPQSNKRRKFSEDVAQDSETSEVNQVRKGPEQKRPLQKGRVKDVGKAVVAEDSGTESPKEPGDMVPDAIPNAAPAAAPAAADISESELSELIDDEPKPKNKKGRPRKQDAEASQGTLKRGEKKKKGTSPDLDPDAEEVKRLQGWLIKCGIRKKWARELKPYDTAKARIRHLRELLAEAGMTGRYSIEKANQIRETRELQADLEAVQEGAKRWGKPEEQEAGERPKRRLARGLEGLDFLNDDDEDSD